MLLYIKRFLSASLALCLPSVCGFAQSLEVKSVFDQFDKAEKVSSGEKIELKVGESIAIYSDTEAIVDRYDAAFEGAYLTAAYVFFSNGSTQSDDSKYIRISQVAPTDDINALYALKPTPGFIDMMIYYSITYYDARGTKRIASGDYPFKVKVVAGEGGGSSSLRQLSLPKEITIREWYDYLLIPTMKPSDAVTSLTWKSDDQGVAFTLAGYDAIDLGKGKYFSENVSLYMSENDCCIRARDEGTATVTVTTEEGLTASVRINVIPYDIRKADIMDVVDNIYDVVKDSFKR